MPSIEASRRNRTVNSALWAAVGDAIGFPTELVTERNLQKRMQGAPVGSLNSWSRIIGGRFGVKVDLVGGAYSDDTQLRLSTSRAISSSGEFDVEAFAKVELPVWLSYALGAGRGSKAAATALSSNNVTWFSNFYDNKSGKYTNGGGNGAAMRIQPHVWASKNLTDEKTYLGDVVRNAICTHGHMRGIAGAMLHAHQLAYSLGKIELLPINHWAEEGVRILRLLPEIIKADSQLSDLWKPAWEKESGQHLSKAIEEVCKEWSRCVKIAVQIDRNDSIDKYSALVEQLGGLTAAERGSGLKCALFSTAAVRWLASLGNVQCLAKIASLLGSDTDTIASMSGSLLGAMSDEMAPSSIQDRDYIEQEAGRLYKIAVGGEVEDFVYPDLLFWQPPRTALDAIGSHDSTYYIAGLGRAEPFGVIWDLPNNGGHYQWFKIWFGQKILCKFRKNLTAKNKDSSLVPVNLSDDMTGEGDLFSSKQKKSIDTELSEPESGFPESIDAISDEIIRSNFKNELIGRAIMSFVSKDFPIENAIALVSIIIKAKLARDRRSK